MKRYRSHKVVTAAKITFVDQNERRAVLHSEGEPGIAVDLEWVDKHAPDGVTSMIDGYYVRYADGYESWSPAAAFEEGYTEVREVQGLPSRRHTLPGTSTGEVQDEFDDGLDDVRAEESVEASDDMWRAWILDDAKRAGIDTRGMTGMALVHTMADRIIALEQYKKENR